LAVMSRLEMLMWTAIVALAVLLFFANQASAHTDEQLTEWMTDWNDRADHALSGVLLDELADMRERHPCWTDCVRAESVSRVPITTSTPIVALAPVEIRELIERYFPAAWVDEALAVSWCESRWRPWVDNPRSSASGLFQFLDSTWSRWGVGSVYDPEANTMAAARLVKHYSDEGYWRWLAWSCQP